jgi:hypothetical protein
MLGKFLQKIFLPKQTRDKLATRPKTVRRDGQPQVAAGRDQLLTEAMTVYRAQMETYESLDPETRRQIEEDAAKAFGEALNQRKS